MGFYTVVSEICGRGSGDLAGCIFVRGFLGNLVESRRDTPSPALLFCEQRKKQTHAAGIPEMDMHIVRARSGHTLSPRDNPVLNNQCWSDDPSATATCCTQFSGKLVNVSGSSIQACTFDNSNQWTSCITKQTSDVQVMCNASSNSGLRRVSTGGSLLVFGLLTGQIIVSVVFSLV
ncbi:hypothetical protein B0H11DRAFT_2189410 [Mycena galericulata]|nr:hypothetical protein B0H11DRAFT_2189410 [Mycena galericulata]